MSTVASKLNISKVGRVCVTVADTDRALDFYVGKLGFEKVVDEPMGPDMRWVEVAGLRRGDDDRARPAAAGPGGRRQPRPGSSSTRSDVDGRSRGAEGGRRGRRRGGHRATAGRCRRCSGSATRTATRSSSSSRRAEHHLRPADGRLPGAPPAPDGGAPRPRAARALGAARALRASRGGREGRTAGRAAACRGRTSARRSCRLTPRGRSAPTARGRLRGQACTGPTPACR